MTRPILRLALTTAGVCLAASLAAQPTPPSFDIAGGPLGLVRGVVDGDGGGPDANDAPVWPLMTATNTFSIETPCGPGSLTAASSNNPPAPGIFDEYRYAGGLFTVDMYSNQNAPTGGTFDDGNTMGTLALMDGGDGLFDEVMLTSTKMRFDGVLLGMQFRDTDGDGFGDWVSLGGLSALLDPCTGFDPVNPIWLPLEYIDPMTKSVVLDTDADGQPDPVFLAGPPLLRQGAGIPTVGTWGLLALILTLVALSLRTLRPGS